MLRYLILSTPRCGSSTLMACAELLLGQRFIREPLNANERPDFHPEILHGKSVRGRAELLCEPDWSIPGIKHVYNPFGGAPAQEEDIAALRRVLSIPGLKVILLTRNAVHRQFVSMEAALQSGDWWSLGSEALPGALGPIKAGNAQPIPDADVARRLVKLHAATEVLRSLCTDTASDFTEHSYEAIFSAAPDMVTANVVRALSHFGSPVSGAHSAALRELIDQGRRFDAAQRLYADISRDYPSLRQFTKS